MSKCIHPAQRYIAISDQCGECGADMSMVMAAAEAEIAELAKLPLVTLLAEETAAQPLPLLDLHPGDYIDLFGNEELPVLEAIDGTWRPGLLPESILEEAHRLTHGDRKVNYGSPHIDYRRTAKLVSALLAHKLTDDLTGHEMALAMCCVKLSREINSPKRDNLVDLAGYAYVAYACLNPEGDDV